MKLSQETLVGVLRSLYEAAVFPERWSEFLSQVQQLFGARQVVFMLHDFSSRQSNIVTQIDLDPEANRLYTEHYAQTDEWWKRGKDIVRPGWAGTSLVCSPFLVQS